MRRLHLFALVLGLWFAMAAALSAQIEVSGRLVDTDGQAIANARLQLVAESSRFERGLAFLEGRGPEEPKPNRVTSDADGAFRLVAPNDGMYRLKISAQGVVPSEVQLFPLVEPVYLGSVTLAPAKRLRIEVSGPDRKPLPGASVKVSTAINGASRWSSRGAYSAQVREQIVTSDSTGSVVVSVPREHTAGAISAWSPGLVGQETVVPKTDLVKIQLAAGILKRLQIRDSSGGVAVGALANLRGFSLPVGVSDENGEIELTVPPKKEVVMTVRSAADEALTKPLEIATEESRPETPVAFRLKSAVRIRGQVADADDRRVLAGAIVWSSNDPGSFVRSGSDGSFTLTAQGGVEDDTVLRAERTSYFRGEVILPPGSLAGGTPTTLALAAASAVSGVVVDGEDKPVAGAVVNPRPTNVDWSARFRTSGSRTPLKAISDAKGRFRFGRMVPESVYRLDVRKTGFAPSEQEIAALGARRERRDVRVVLRAGRVAIGLVADASEQPIVGAEVELVPKESGSREIQRIFAGDDDGSESHRTASDELGRFEIDDLPEGSFNLVVRAESFAPATVPGIDIPGGAGTADLGTVYLDPGERIEGYTVDGDGVPVEGAEIYVESDALWGRIAALRSSVDKETDAVSGVDGRFVIGDQARDDPVGLYIEREGYVSSRVPGVRAPTTEPLRVVLEVGGRVSGKVVDGDGEPIPQARVMLQQSEGGTRGGMVMMMGTSPGTTTTDEEGLFEITGLKPARMRLVASANGFQQSPGQTIELESGQDLSDQVITLEPGAEVTGRVVSRTGSPVSDAQVRLQDPSERRRFRLGGVFGRSDADGNYRLQGAPPGEHSVVVTHSDFESAVRDLDIRPGDNRLDFTLDEGAVISGRVIGPAGEPIAGATVNLASSGSGRFFGFVRSQSTTRADGSFEIKGVSEGTYQVRAQKDGFAAAELPQPIDVGAAGAAGLELRLQGGAVVTGQVLGLEFDDLAKVQIFASDQKSMLQTASADFEGAYRVENLSAGEWVVMGRLSESGQQVMERVVIEPGDTEVVVDLRFGDGVTLSGQVLVSGEPLSGARVTAMGADVSKSGRSSTDHEGRFLVQGLESGTYTVNVMSIETGMQHREQVEMSGDQDLLIEIEVGRLSGRVIDSFDRSGVAGATVAVASTEAEGDNPFSFMTELGSTTDVEGGYVLSRVPEGRYTLTVTRDGYTKSEKEIQVFRGAEERADVELSPSDGQAIEVRAATGRGVVEARVAAFGPNGDAVLTGVFSAGENGRIRLDSLPAGTWSLLVSAAGSGTARVDVTSPGPVVSITTPVGTSIDVSAPELASSGRTGVVTVKDRAGRPFRQLDFLGQPRERWPIYLGRTTIGELPPGTWTVTLSSGEGTTEEREVLTRAGAPAAVVFD